MIENMEKLVEAVRRLASKEAPSAELCDIMRYALQVSHDLKAYKQHKGRLGLSFNDYVLRDQFDRGTSWNDMVEESGAAIGTPCTVIIIPEEASDGKH